MFGEVEFINLARTLTRGYRFRNDNKEPKAIVIPNITSVDGIAREYKVVSMATKVETKKEAKGGSQKV